MTTKDAGGLFLHPGHALRVTGSQAMSRASLPEHTISLVARWGSAALFNYIHKAPLASTHQLAKVALAGCRLNRTAAGSQKVGVPGARSIVAGPHGGVQRQRPWTHAPTSMESQLGLRLTAGECHIAELP